MSGLFENVARERPTAHVTQHEKSQPYKDLKMSRSEYLHRVLHLQQNPVSAKIFNELAGSLFLEPGTACACVEVYSPDLAPSDITDWDERMQYDQLNRLRSMIDVKDTLENRDEKIDFLKSHSILQSSKREGDTILSLRTTEDLKQYVAMAKRFQAFFIRQRHSYSPLTITNELFESLLLEKDVSPQFRDYVLYMGEREREVEIVPPRLRWRKVPTRSVGENCSTFECMYGLRFVELNGRGNACQPTSRWSFRQTAVYCSFRSAPEDSTWIFVTPSRLAQQRMHDYASCRHQSSEFDPFEIHLLLLDTAMVNWRHYLIDLAAETDQHAAQLLGASPDDQGPISMADCGERQALMILDDKLQNTATVIKSTIENVKAHLDCHGSVQEGAPKDEEPPRPFVIPSFMEQLHELHMLTVRVDALRTRLQGITSLVSSFLELNNGFALQSLAKESRKENEEMRKLSQRMHGLTEKGTQDAAAVKVLTILTLIYLPATVVSNFFSTSFVNLQTSAGKPNHVVVSGDWWIFVAASLPLTLLTLYTWWVWTRIKAYNSYPFWWIGQRASTASKINSAIQPGEKV
jgi:hypothetical protein